jgi:hypothetical protein
MDAERPAAELRDLAGWNLDGNQSGILVGISVG